MKMRELERELMALADLKYAEDWDNSGLQCGRLDKDIHRVFIALDATNDVIDQAIEAKSDLILTHHPLIFNPVSKIDADDYLGKRLYRIIQNDIVLYATHTNFDVCCMREALDERIGLKDVEPLELLPGYKDTGIGSVGYLEKEMTVSELMDRILERFEISNVKVFGDTDRKVRKVGVLGGSGKSEIDLAVDRGCDVYISGDIDHHSGIDAVEKGISVIDAGHYGLEHVFCEYMKEYLESKFKDIEILLEIKHEPYVVYK